MHMHNEKGSVAAMRKKDPNANIRAHNPGPSVSAETQD
jgi:hypothetical protein